MGKANINISITTDTDEFTGKMKGFVKQVPFALSLSLNKTAKAAVKDVKEDLRKTFIIRGSQWVPKGIRMRPSTKTNLVAAVGSLDDFMPKQFEGGEKRAASGKLAIPLIGKGRARGRKRSTTLPKDWPKALAARDPDVFVGTAGRRKKSRSKKYKGTGGGTYAVWRRLPKHRLKMVYAFKEKVNIKARWKIDKIVGQSVEKNWPGMVAEAIQEAQRTARR